MVPRTLLPLLTATLTLQACATAEPVVLTLTTTTSTENSGLLAWIHPDFEERTGVKLRVVAKGTGAALQLAREGNADVVLVHAPALEERFVADGFGLERVPVMYNDFVLIGPQEGTLGTAACDSAPRAMARLADAGALFVSRGDASGTHVKEQELWQASGVALEERSTGTGFEARMALRPGGAWYRAVGQGMGPTIGYATERRGYTLADRGTYYALALDEPSRTDLIIACEGDARLANPYAVIAVNPDRHSHVQRDAALAYVSWLASADTQERIGAYRRGGKVLFHPGPAPVPRAEATPVVSAQAVPEG